MALFKYVHVLGMNLLSVSTQKMCVACSFKMLVCLCHTTWYNILEEYQNLWTLFIVWNSK
jgi:hypothetical protein